MTTPQTRSLNQKLASQSRNVFVVVLLTYIPFAMIAYGIDILVAFTWQSFIYDNATALDNTLTNLDRFLAGWILIKLSHAHPHITVPIAWGVCCLYHRKLVFDLPQKTLWFFILGLTVLWLHTAVRRHYFSLLRKDFDYDLLNHVQAISSILTVLLCWWLVERWRAKILPEE